MKGSNGRDDEVRLEDRIQVFDRENTLEADCREIWSLIEPEKETVARQFWIEYARSPDLPVPLDELLLAGEAHPPVVPPRRRLPVAFRRTLPGDPKG